MVCIRACDKCGKSTSVHYTKDMGMLCILCERPKFVEVGPAFEDKLKQYVFDFYWDVDYKRMWDRLGYTSSNSLIGQSKSL